MLKKDKQLKDLDNLPIGKSKSETQDEELLLKAKICEKCKKGYYILVKPKVEMAGMLLYQCDSCSERRYI